MQKLTEKAFATQIMLTAFVAGATDRLRRDERGQGAVEYLGVVIVAALIVIAVIAFADDIGDAIGNFIEDRVDEVGEA